MARRKTPKHTASNEKPLDETTPEVTMEDIKQAEEESPIEARTISSANPMDYINQAVPKLRVSLVNTSEEDGDIEDLEVMRQVLKKDRIKASKYEITDRDEILSDAFKNSCCVIVNSPENFKEVATRAFLSGRYVITWFPSYPTYKGLDAMPEEAEDYYKSPYCIHLKNISQIPDAVRWVKSQYTEQKIKDIRNFVLERVKYE